MAKRRNQKAPPPVADVSPEDLALFEREVEGARQLARDGRERVRVSPSPEPVLPSTSARQLPAAPVPVDEEEGARLESYVAPGVDRRELRKLKRGDHAPDLHLDLHGLTASEAVTQVMRVLDRPSGGRPRCLCVVHGRGLHSPDNIPVLKSRVRACLRAHPFVLAFSDAPKDAGGPGAVFVLLRR